MKPILLIPVFRGGAFFQECLQSLKPHQDAFERIVISINGDAHERELDRFTLAQSGLKTKDIIVFETRESLGAAAHGVFMLRSMRKIGLDDNAQVMTLFHDDWVVNSPEGVLLGSDEVLLGDWITNNSKEVMSSALSAKTPIRDWIQQGGAGFEFINGSGIIAPLGVRRSAARIMSFFRTGVRYEYFLLTHRRIRFILKSHNPLVKIRIHPGQDGQQQTSFSTLRGDVAYVLWLCFQGRIRSWRSIAYVGNLIITSTHSAFLRLRQELIQRRG